MHSACNCGVAQFRAALFTRFYLCFQSSACGEKQRGRMLTRFLHDRAGIPWKESETALPRHQDTQLSPLSLMRDFQTELPANSCRFLAVFIASCIPVEERYSFVFESIGKRNRSPRIFCSLTIFTKKKSINLYNRILIDF